MTDLFDCSGVRDRAQAAGLSRGLGSCAHAPGHHRCRRSSRRDFTHQERTIGAATMTLVTAGGSAQRARKAGAALTMGGVECVFCAIAAGGPPAHRVLADETAVAFLDARPLFPGHVLVVPRRHVGTLTDLPEADVGPFFARVRRIAGAVERGMGAAGSFVAANNRVSQSVPHFHVHVVPRNRKDGLRGFFWPRTRYASEEEAEGVAARIRAALADGGG